MQAAFEPNKSQSRVVPLRPNTAPISKGRISRHVKIGRILLASDLITQDCLTEALTIAEELKQPIGKVLTSTQQVSDQDLQSALLAQSMMAEGLVEEPLALEALKLAARESVPFAVALESIKNAINKAPLTQELEELLVGAEMVGQPLVEEAKRQSLETGLPLGSSLMMMRVIVFAHLNYAFECLNLIREGRLSKENAIKALSEIKKDNIDLAEALRRQRISPRNTQSKLKLGDLLTAGSVISEKDNLAAVERALMEKRLVGEILVKSGLVSAELLRDALNMQTLVVKGVIDKDEAAVVLRQVVEERKSILDVVKTRRTFQDDETTASQALDLLIEAKIVDSRSVPSAMSQQSEFGMDALKALVASDFVTSHMCQAAVECVKMVANGKLSKADSILVINHCDRSRCEFQQAARDLGLGFMGKEEKATVKTSSHLKVATPASAATEHQSAPKRPTWARSFECLLAVFAALLAIGGSAATMMLNPTSVSSYCLLGILLAVGIAFFALGRFWELRLKEHKQEVEKKEAAARQSVSRLVKIRSRQV